MGRVDGKVAVITGAARGQGRAHAVRLAEEGADIIALDIGGQIDTVPYELGSDEDLNETKQLVEETGRRAVIAHADVRSRDDMERAVQQGLREFGRLDIVIANAGIWSSAPFLEMSDELYHDMIDVQLHGTYNTCKATLPTLVEQGQGGSVIFINSTAGMTGFPNQAHYNAAKHGAIGLMRSLANEFASDFIRVNSIHPSSTFTQMINNPAIWKVYAPGVDNPTENDFGETFKQANLLPIPWAEPVDIANAVLWLASDESRYVTGVTLPVDAGFLIKV